MSASSLYYWLWLAILFMCPGSQSLAQTSLEEICAPYQTAAIDTADIDEIPFGNGLLWKIETTNGRHSHIFGTMHSQDLRVTSLPPVVRLAMAKSRELLIEVIPDEQSNAVFFRRMYADRKLLSEDLPDALLEQLESIASAYNVDAKDVERLEPWAAFSLIGRLEPVNASSQDQVIYENFSRSEREVTGLETMSELIDTLAGLPEDDQITILTDTICNHSRIVADSENLLNMYVRQDLAGMVAFNQQPHHDEAVFDRFMQRVLYDRNK
ncbi:MAG: TraB/GumN family protein, partial [Gammaproteobacteria bacterium]